MNGNIQINIDLPPDGLSILVMTWWHHDMETLATLLALCGGKPLVTVGIPSQCGSGKHHCNLDDVIKWEHFSRYWSPVNSPHKCQWCGALMFALICAWINGWANNRDIADLRCHHAHYDVTVMDIKILPDVLGTKFLKNCCMQLYIYSIVPVTHWVWTKGFFC